MTDFSKRKSLSSKVILQVPSIMFGYTLLQKENLVFKTRLSACAFS